METEIIIKHYTMDVSLSIRYQNNNIFNIMNRLKPPPKIKETELLILSEGKEVYP